MVSDTEGMSEKKGCFPCHFLSVITWNRERAQETFPLPQEYRNKDEFISLVRKCTGSNPNRLICFHGYWDAAKINAEQTAEIENMVFRKGRGKKCPLFAPLDSAATPEAVMKGSQRTSEFIDRKTTRRLAWIAIGASVFATLLAAIIPILLSR